MAAPALSRSLVPLLLTVAWVTDSGCGGTSVPEARRALREVPLTSSLDLAAHGEAKAAHLLLNEWCGQAVALRETGEELAADDPALADDATAAVDQILQASERAESPELRSLLSALAEAHALRLELLRRSGKHAPKKYLRVERQVVELGFGLRRWRNQR